MLTILCWVENADDVFDISVLISHYSPPPSSRQNQLGPETSSIAFHDAVYMAIITARRKGGEGGLKAQTAYSPMMPGAALAAGGFWRKGLPPSPHFSARL